MADKIVAQVGDRVRLKDTLLFDPDVWGVVTETRGDFVTDQGMMYYRIRLDNEKYRSRDRYWHHRSWIIEVEDSFDFAVRQIREENGL